MNTSLHPALAPLIEALARQAAQDYLTAQAAASNDPAGERSEPVALHPVDRAA
ncbi:hypothetical protein ISP17_11230 [Dyella ginsengisoli]|uniref:Uncharacterized protein n=1 Tax=Dyella ginsengisoli TaxID=363848 RepID=A0ABW8JUF5_9GAMM